MLQYNYIILLYNYNVLLRYFGLYCIAVYITVCIFYGTKYLLLMYKKNHVSLFYVLFIYFLCNILHFKITLHCIKVLLFLLCYSNIAYHGTHLVINDKCIGQLYRLIPAVRLTCIACFFRRFLSQISADFDEILRGLFPSHAATTVTFFMKKYYIVRKLDHLTCSKFVFTTSLYKPIKLVK